MHAGGAESYCAALGATPKRIVAIMLYVYNSQLIRLKTTREGMDSLLPMCKTIADFVDHCERENLVDKVYRVVENSRFRTMDRLKVHVSRCATMRTKVVCDAKKKPR